MEINYSEDIGERVIANLRELVKLLEDKIKLQEQICSLESDNNGIE
jgi:hypothetical protein